MKRTLIHRLVVHTGPMFSGKTIPLAESYEEEKSVHRYPLAFRPLRDTRTDKPVIESRFSKITIPAQLVESSEQILEIVMSQAHPVSQVIIDEAQFFNHELKVVVKGLLEICDVVVAGLDLDYRGLPFGPMGDMLALASVVIKHTAQCDRCRRNKNPHPGRYTQRLTNGQPSSAFEEGIVPEHSKTGVVYGVRCAKHFQPPPDLDLYLLSHETSCP